MKRLAMTVGKKKAVILGLDPENVERLLKGEPIRVNLNELDPDGPPTGLPDIDVYVAATDTEDWRRFIVGLRGVQ